MHSSKKKATMTNTILALDNDNNIGFIVKLKHGKAAANYRWNRLKLVSAPSASILLSMLLKNFAYDLTY